MRQRRQKFILAYLREKLPVNRIKDGNKSLAHVIGRVCRARLELLKATQKASALVR